MTSIHIPTLFREELELFHAASARAGAILITATEREDGDSVASELAVRYILEKTFPAAGKTIHIVNEQACPDRYRFLHGAEGILPLDAAATNRYDLGIVVDCGADRSGLVRPLFLSCPFKVKIDHHSFGNSGRYDVSVSTSAVASTTEILFQFVTHPRWAVPLDAVLAELIYVGILCDTGAFRYDLTRPSTHAIASRLIETGFDFPRTAERVHLERSFPMKKLLGRVLDTLEVAPHGRYLHAVITRGMMAGTGSTREDAGDVIDEICFVRGVEVSILFVEQEDGAVRVSLRSKGDFNVGDFARRVVDTGGGHPRAAGCSFDGPLPEVKRHVFDLLDRELAKR